MAELTSSKRLRILILSAAVIIIAVILPFVTLGCTRFEGLMFADECYQAICINYINQSPMAMLSFWQAHLWLDIFGNSLLNLRLLYALCVLLTAAIGALTAYRFTRQVLYSSLLFVATVIGGILCYLPLYGWDVGAYPYLVALFSLTLFYRRKPRLWLAVALGAVGALMALARVPLLLLCAVVLVVMVLTLRRNGQPIARHLLFAIAAFIIVALLMMTIMTGSPLAYINIFIGHKAITGHSGLQLLSYIVWSSVHFSHYLLVGVLPLSFLFMYCILARPGFESWPVKVITVAICIVLGYFVYYVFYGLLKSVVLQGLCLPMYILPAVIPWLMRIYGRKNSTPSSAAWILICFIIFSFVGSDSPLVRLGQTAWAIPYAFLIGWENSGERMRPFLERFIRYSTITLLCVWALAAHYTRVSTSLVTEDIPYLHGISVEEKTHAKLQAINPQIDELKTAGRNFEIAGFQAYGYNAAFTPDCPISLQHFHWETLGIEPDLQMIRSMAARRDAIIFMSLRPGQPLTGTDKAVGEELQRLGFVQTADFKYGRTFVRSDNSEH